MLRSMTAFARLECQTQWGQLSWELRTVNHRYLDISLRMPEEFRGQEAVVREHLAASIRRGKVDANLRFRPESATDSALTLNHGLIEALLAAMKEIDEVLDNPARPHALEILHWPGVIQAPSTDLTPVSQQSLELLDDTLQQLSEGREREGGKLQALLEQRCSALSAEAARVREALPEILVRQRDRLAARLEEFRSELDASRLEQEFVLLANRIDVQEELDRLDVHVTEVRRVLDQDEPVGRRLDFLMQEFNREANTLGSKSVDSVTTSAAVEMKVIIEQMREQIQNIE